MSLFRGAGVFGEVKYQSPANRSNCETLEPTKTIILDVKCAIVESVGEKQKSIKGLIRCETKGQILCKKDFSISWKDARLCTSNNRRHQPPAFLNWRRVFEVIESYLRWKWTRTNFTFRLQRRRRRWRRWRRLEWSFFWTRSIFFFDNSVHHPAWKLWVVKTFKFLWKNGFSGIQLNNF